MSEVTVIYATGQTTILIRESSKRVSEQESRGTLYIRATPSFRKPITPAEFPSLLAFHWREGTHFFATDKSFSYAETALRPRTRSKPVREYFSTVETGDRTPPLRASSKEVTVKFATDSTARGKNKNGTVSRRQIDEPDLFATWHI